MSDLRSDGIQALSPLSFSDQILDGDNQGASDPVGREMTIRLAPIFLPGGY
jgi:hypothetical protein